VSGTTDASWTVSIYATYRDTDANDIEVIGSSDRSKYFDKAIRAVTVANRCGARMTTVRFSETTALVPDERGVFGITGLDTLLPANATITDCKFKLYVSTNSVNTTDLSAFRSFKPAGFDAVQGTFLTTDTLGMTWNNWKQIDGAVGPDSAWTTAGCGMADDDSTDNRWSGNGGDRKATAEGSTAITGTGWIEIDITNALAQAWYDGTAWENGLLIKNAEAAGDNFVYTKEYNKAQYAPRWYFSYTLPAAEGGVNPRRRRILSGGQ